MGYTLSLSDATDGIFSRKVVVLKFYDTPQILMLRSKIRAKLCVIPTIIQRASSSRYHKPEKHVVHEETAVYDAEEDKDAFKTVLSVKSIRQGGIGHASNWFEARIDAFCRIAPLWTIVFILAKRAIPLFAKSL